MATAEQKLFSPAKWNVRANATNAPATATKAAPGAGLRHYVTGVIFSCAPVTTAAVTVSLTDGGTDVFNNDLAIGFGVNGLAILFPRPYEAGENAAVTAVITAGGASVVGKVSLLGFTA